jgi:elongation factor Ts
MISASQVKELRDATGAGMMDCKKALTEAEGNIEEATVILRKKGLSAAAKKAGRVASEGLVESYIHFNGRIGVIAEVNCETDFVAKTDDFKKFAKDVCKHIAATSPRWVSPDEVPGEDIEREKDILRDQAKNEGKPDAVVEKIVEGRVNKFYAEHCLLEQSFIMEDDKTVRQVMMELIARLGENIAIRRFTRYQLGEGIEKKTENFAEEVMKQVNS